MMAARIEFEKEWLPKFGKDVKPKTNFKVTNKATAKAKALGSIKSEGLKSILDNLWLQQY